MTKGHALWDLPTRVFHWTIVLCVCLSWWSGEQGEFDRHAWFGYTALVLVGFRVIWGFLGSRHSRFSDFVSGPAGVWAYVRRGQSASVGHNPLGGWSVLLMLVLLFIQGFSGLFNSDDLMFEGPFYYGASGSFRDTMGVVHELAFYALSSLIVLHLLAVSWYQWRRKMPLIQAMVRGQAEGRQGLAPPVPAWIALIIIVLLAVLLWWAVSAAPQPERFW